MSFLTLQRLPRRFALAGLFFLFGFSARCTFASSSVPCSRIYPPPLVIGIMLFLLTSRTVSGLAFLRRSIIIFRATLAAVPSARLTRLRPGTPPQFQLHVTPARLNEVPPARLCRRAGWTRACRRATG